MKLKNEVTSLPKLKNILLVRTAFNDKILIKCTLLKRQKTEYKLVFKIRFKHGINENNTSIIYYVFESDEPLTDYDIGNIYIALIELFNDIPLASTIFTLDYGYASIVDTENLTATELKILQTTIYYKCIIHNVLLQASTYMDGGKELLNFIIDYMEDIQKWTQL